MHNVQFTRVSRNVKTGPIPVTTTDERSCPDSCPLKGAGCYAEYGNVRRVWDRVTKGAMGGSWQEAMDNIRALPKGQLWRHNQAGDLPGIGDRIDTVALSQLVAANAGKRGFTYTHKPMTPENMALVEMANSKGFTVNLSADDLAEADELAALSVAPVVVVLPHDQTRAVKTPEGRAVAICPATISDSVTCASCGLCAVKDRAAIIGFPAHGPAKKRVAA